MASLKSKIKKAVSSVKKSVSKLPVQKVTVNTATKRSTPFYPTPDGKLPASSYMTVAPVYQGPAINTKTGKSAYSAPGGMTIAPNMSLLGSPSGYGINGQALSKTGQIVAPIALKKSGGGSSGGQVLGANNVFLSPLASNVIGGTTTSSRISSPSSSQTSSLGSNTPNLPNSNVINTPTLAAQNTKLTLPEPVTPDYTMDIPSPISTPEQIAQDATKEKDTSLQDYLDTLLNDAPNSAEAYKKAQKETQILQRQQEVNDLTATLNGIVNKGQAQQLAQVGQGRGIPEAIIGGIQAQIGRETAIAALPVQAQLSAAQGNLEMANDNLDTLFKIYSDDAEREYSIRREQKKLVYDYATEKEKRALEKLDKLEERSYQETLDLNDERLAYSKMAFANGQSTLGAKIAKLDYKSPTFRDDLANLQSQLRDPAQELELQLKRAQIASANRANQASGGVNGKINPKILTTTQFKSAQAAQNLKNTLKNTKDAIAKYGNYEKLNATGKGVLNALKIQLASQISTAFEQGVIQPGEMENFQKVAGQLQKSNFLGIGSVRNKVSLGSVTNLEKTMDDKLALEKAALSNTYDVTTQDLDTLLNITDLSDQEFADMDALVD